MKDGNKDVEQQPRADWEVDLELLKALQTPTRKIGVHEFKEYFLQMYIDGPDKAPDEALNAYITYAGSPTAALSMVDDTGKEIMIIPPIFYTERLTTKVTRRIEEVYKRVVERGHGLENVENNILEQGFKTVDEVIDQDTPDPRIKIFEYFGVTDKVTTSSTSTNTDSDDLYDDWG